MAQRCAGGGINQASDGGLSESQLDELARCMQAEVVTPLHARIRELTSQVQTLREEASQLERRWRNLDLAGQASREDPSGSGLGAKAIGAASAGPVDQAELEQAQVKEIE